MKIDKLLIKHNIFKTDKDSNDTEEYRISKNTRIRIGKMKIKRSNQSV